MVESLKFIAPFAVVVVLWFVSTGLVAMLNHRLRTTSGRALAIATMCAMSGLGLILLSTHSTSEWAIYMSFVGGLLVWSWHEISFLTGAVSGSHRDPCPPEARGWQRFSLATMALIHHEIALAMTAALLLSLASVTSNTTGAYTFALLLLFRLSSKLNIYQGVPSMSDELLPAHLGYLKSYFGPKQLHPGLVLSTALILALAIWFLFGAITTSQSDMAVQAGLLCCLCLLGALEHLFLAIPFRDSELWRWALAAKEKTNLGEGVQP
ncbi:putative photosynthetic complex assembly protein PuhE [Sphingorhabdus sp.]|uniref:putative photosynthetic complex assembly protein PuhE n=1 Tax=Sphingorhabdus sp. TaxID=1902408 RepID=UPI0035939B5B